tara:strand:- start:1779 stop:2186 length:408 start_codon:yes stop_codon:yes gene_type:complete
MTYLFNMPNFKKVSFEQFYSAYPRKVGRYTAEKSFKKLSAKDKFDAYNGLQNYLKYWKASETEKQFIPHPSTFINQKRWEDEIDIPTQKAEYKRDSTGRFFIAYCQKCKISDFYNDYELKGDSRCCNSNLLPERG